MSILELIFIIKSSGTMVLIKDINGGLKAYFGLENNYKETNFLLEESC
jgi:hypothetical protein